MSFLRTANRPAPLWVPGTSLALLVLVLVGAGCSNSSFAVASDGDSGALDGGQSDAASPDTGPADATPPVPFLVRDTFTRTAVSSLGEADIGGLWTVHGSPDAFAVAKGTGVITVPAAGAGRDAELLDVKLNDTDAQVAFSIDAAVTGNGVFTSLVLRAMGGNNDYRATTILRSDGRVDATVVQRLSNIDTALASSAVPILTSARGEIRVRAQAFGASPTRLRMKVWQGDVEPPSWLIDLTDTTLVLQGKGNAGIGVYVSQNATVFPIALSFDNFFVRQASLLPD